MVAMPENTKQQAIKKPRTTAARAAQKASIPELADLSTGDRVRGVAIDGQEFEGFVDAAGRQYLKLTDGKKHKIRSIELVRRLPDDLEIYCALPGANWADKVDSLLSEFQFYNLSNWRTTGEESQHFERYKDWQISFYQGEEVDLSKDGETWYTELKRHPELRGNGQISKFCRKAIDHVESILQRIAEYEADSALDPEQGDRLSPPAAPTDEDVQAAIVPGDDLDADIDRLYGEAMEAKQTAERASMAAAQLYFELGKRLIDRKDQLKHGQWLPYLAEHGIPNHTAQRAMQIAAHFGEIQHVLNLSLNEALRQSNRAKLPVGKNEQLSLMAAIEEQTIVPGQELFFNNLPCKVIKINGDWLHVQFLDTGRYTNLEKNRFTLCPVEVNPASVRSCPTCKHCEAAGDDWYCQKFQQQYNAAENPAPNCQQYSEGPTERPVQPASSAAGAIALPTIARGNYRPGESIQVGDRALRIQLVGTDSLTAVDDNGAPYRIAFQLDTAKPSAAKPSAAKPEQLQGKADIFYAIRKFALLNDRMWSEAACDRAAVDVLKFLGEYEP